MGRHIAIIGAGVSGLSTALELLREGHDVTVYAREVTPNTTSDIAAAIWMPYKVEPQEEALKWALTTLEELKKIARESPEAGIVFKEHTELSDIPVSRPPWMEYLDACPVPDYVAGKYKNHSYTVMVPVIDTQKYMPYLHQCLERAGGVLIIEEIHNMDDLLEVRDIVINCTGLGARVLAQDEAVYPIRGQVLSIKKIPGFDRSMVRPNELAHIITRTEDCLVGGTAEEGNWELSPDVATTATIRAKLFEILPSLREEDVEVLAEKVGLRPGRSTVRLEADPNNECIFHNYGHGGAGFTVSWGCAKQVAGLAIDYLNRLSPRMR